MGEEERDRAACQGASVAYVGVSRSREDRYVDELMQLIHDRQIAKPVVRGYKNALKLFCEIYGYPINPEILL